MAASLGGEVAAFGLSPAVDDLARFGAATVYSVTGVGDRLPAGPIAAAAVPYEDFDLVLFPTSRDARDLAGRLSARLDRTVVTNAVGVEAGDGGLLVHTWMLGGSVAVTTLVTGPRPWLVVLRPRAAMAVERPVEARVVEVAAPDVEAPVVVARFEEPPAEGPSLATAEVVVAGGRGVLTAEGYGLVRELARLLGGAPAATRAAVDAGWVPHTAQVGQTGTTVAPTVYLAFGVSGAPQHLVGMTGAKQVVAVNSDRDAPIVAAADLTVVGDATSVLARLVAALSPPT